MQRLGMRGDHQIVWADHPALFFKLRVYRPIVARGIGIE